MTALQQVPNLTAAELPRCHMLLKKLPESYSYPVF